MEILITRAEAILQDSVYFFTGEPCKHGHRSQRYTKDTKCVTCVRNRINTNYEINKVAKAEVARLWYLANPEARMLHSARKRAKKDNLPFSITLKDIIIPEFCPILGIKLERGSTGRPCDSSPSLDKLKPELGYVPGNVSVIGYRANTLKNNATSDELRAIAKWMDS